MPSIQSQTIQTLDDIIGQGHIVKTLKDIINDYKIKQEKIPHFLFVGSPGVGKTSVANAFAHDIDLYPIEYNASDDRGIDFIRKTLKIVSQTKGDKIIILDEFDAMTAPAQDAAKRIIELSTVPIILTANDKTKIIDPIKSRCVNFEFNKLTDIEMVQVIRRIFNQFDIKFERDDLKEIIDALVKQTNGDARMIHGIIEKIRHSGQELTISMIHLHIPKDSSDKIIEAAFNGTFDQALQILEDLFIKNQLNPDITIRQFYDALKRTNLDWTIKYKMYDKLADAERGIKEGCSPLIQLASFLGLVYSSKQFVQAKKPEVLISGS